LLAFHVASYTLLVLVDDELTREDGIDEEVYCHGRVSLFVHRYIVTMFG